MQSNEDELNIETQPKSKATKPKMIDVKVIAQEGDKIIVEYQPNPQAFERVIINLDHLENGKADKSLLENSLQYGVDFAKFEVPAISADEIAFELHRNGLYTREQIMTDRPAVIRSLKTIEARYIAALIDYIRNL